MFAPLFADVFRRTGVAVPGLKFYDMNILVTGMSGFVGQEVKRGFKAAGHAVKGVPRQVLMDGGEQLDELLEDADVVINLAGASLMGRWTEEYKKKILISRQIGTQNLVDAMNRVKRNKEPEIGVKLFISASAVGIYRTGALSDENTQEIESGFLPEVVKTWESEATQALGVRTVILRFGVIVGKSGGVIQKLLPLVHSRLAVVAGSGKQPFPLIHIDDVVGFMLYALKHEDVEGVYNMVIPEETTYRGFIKALSKIRRPWLTFSLPEGVLKLAMGNSVTILTRTPHVVPGRLQASGYPLKYKTVDEVVGEIARSL